MIERYKRKDLFPRIAVLRGGTGSGKTYSALQFILSLAYKGLAKRIHVVGVTYPHLKLGAFADTLKIIDKWHIKADINRVDLEIRINESQIKFISADKSEKLRGLRRDVLYINEVNLIGRDFFDELVVRTHDFVIVDFNPVKKFWIVDYFLEKNLDISAFEIVTTFRDNPHLPQNARLEIESRIGTDWFVSMGEGEWGSEGDDVLYNWEVGEAPIKRELGIGLDIGYTVSPSAGVLLCKTTDDRILAKELFKGNFTLQEVIEKIMPWKTKLHIIVDAAAKDAIDVLKRNGFAAWESKKPSLLASFEKINSKRILVSPNSINLIREMRNLVWKDKIKGITSGEDHLIDALRYAFHSFVL